MPPSKTYSVLKDINERRLPRRAVAHAVTRLSVVLEPFAASKAIDAGGFSDGTRLCCERGLQHESAMCAFLRSLSFPLALPASFDKPNTAHRCPD